MNKPNYKSRPCLVCEKIFKPTSGISKYCSKECRKIGNQEYNKQYRKNYRPNPEKRRQSQRAYLVRHPDRRKLTSKTYYDKIRSNPEKYARFLALSRECYARNPETSYLYALNWRSENRESVRARNKQQDAERKKILKQGNRKEVVEYISLIKSDLCSYCGSNSTVTDHIEPLARGGQHRAENLTRACRPCNARKGAQSLLIFLLKRQNRQNSNAPMDCIHSNMLLKTKSSATPNG